MKLHEQLGIDPGNIDRMLREVLESDASLAGVSDIREHALELIDAGGKRLRPIMTIVGGRFGDAGRLPDVMRAAAVLEYIHTASLIHDDIIDKSDLRRGRPTLHTRVGVSKAVFIANYMTARAVEWATGTPGAPDSPSLSGTDRPSRSPVAGSASFVPSQAAASGDRSDGPSRPWASARDSAVAPQPSASERDFERIAGLASLITELCLGEYGQLRDRFNFELTLEQYLDKTRRKTALLMAHCLKAGADAADADGETAELLFRFGEALGIAFQIRDDMLDFAETKETILKPAGADLRNGNVTLPVLFALDEPALAGRIRSLHAYSSDGEFAEVISLIAASGAMERTREIARSYTDRAAELAAKLSGHPAGGNLLPLLRYFSQ